MENRLPVMEKITLLGCVAAAVLMLAAILWGGYYNNDPAEHLHAAWLVLHGEVPYRDFFEHHHPLMWYVLAPVLEIGGRNAGQVYMTRVLAVLLLFGAVYIAYRINRDFLFGRTAAVFGVLSVLLCPHWFFEAVHLRPDSFMLAAFLGGVWCFFLYLRDGWRRWLVFSYLLVAAAFWFQAKAAVWLLGFGVVNLYLLRQGLLRTVDVLWAAVLPLAATAGYLLYLYAEGALGAFWRLNYLFNMMLAGYYGAYADHAVVPILKGCGVLLWAGAAFLWQKGPAMKPYGGVLLVLGGFMGIGWLMFAPHDFYMMPFFVLMSGFCGRFFELVLQKSRVAAGVLCVWLFLSLSLAAALCALPNRSFTRAMKVWDYVVRHSDEKDVVLNGNFIINLFNEDADWMWFGFHGVSHAYDRWTGSRYDRTETIKRAEPKFLELRYIPNEIMLRRGVAAGYDTDENYVRQFYEPVDNRDIGDEFWLWRRKGQSGTKPGTGV